MKSQTVLIEDTKYTLDVDRAIELGVLKVPTPTRKLTFSDIKIGETFCYIDSSFKGVYIKTDAYYANALCGYSTSSSKNTYAIGEIESKCYFTHSNSEVKVYRNGKYVTEVPLDK